MGVGVWSNGTAAPPAKSKTAARGPQNVRRSLERCLPLKEKTDENSGHYGIASSQPPERRPLERQYLNVVNTEHSLF